VRSVLIVVLGTVVIVVASIGAGVLAVHLRDQSELKMSMDRVPGPNALQSRCQECVQSGDRITISTVGPHSFTRGVRVYVGEDLVAACACSSLTFAVATGHYVAVGFQVRGECPTPIGKLDEDLTALGTCGATIGHVRLDAL